MGQVKNILFIMFDQLRWDYLSCAGHPHLHTPNIDSLAAEGMRFTRAYCQSPVCGASRMSFYTGRYCHSHGATWNRVPLKVGEHTLGDHFRRNRPCLGLHTCVRFRGVGVGTRPICGVTWDCLKPYPSPQRYPRMELYLLK